eukprot:CAMPEP_0194298364 /NCGR_PEP_ID=MMETSP0169-20130528/60124_1 /TAXON_ID=218684 /ORGANISM="Corethron pennatum, Strain L29A3" /LENGTH=1345 /DNA_ID=CAMNT_0039048341 /DNA_START=34 /DNA_END=4068 /DNA_ORIENTATION=-
MASYRKRKSSSSDPSSYATAPENNGPQLLSSSDRHLLASILRPCFPNPSSLPPLDDLLTHALPVLTGALRRIRPRDASDPSISVRKFVVEMHLREMVRRRGGPVAHDTPNVPAHARTLLRLETLRRPSLSSRDAPSRFLYGRTLAVAIRDYGANGRRGAGHVLRVVADADGLEAVAGLAHEGGLGRKACLAIVKDIVSGDEKHPLWEKKDNGKQWAAAVMEGKKKNGEEVYNGADEVEDSEKGEKEHDEGVGFVLDRGGGESAADSAEMIDEEEQQDDGAASTNQVEDGFVIDGINASNVAATSPAVEDFAVASSKDDDVISAAVDPPVAHQEKLGHSLGASSHMPKKLSRGQKKSLKKKKAKQKMRDLQNDDHGVGDVQMLETVGHDAVEKVERTTHDDKQVTVASIKGDEAFPVSVEPLVVNASKQPLAASAIVSKETTSYKRNSPKKKKRKISGDIPDKHSGAPTSEAAEDGVMETVTHDEKQVTSTSSKDNGISSADVELSASPATAVSAKKNLSKKKKTPKKKKGKKIVDIPDAGNENGATPTVDTVKDDSVGARTVEDKQVTVDLSKDEETAPAGAGLSVVGHEISEQPPAGSAVSPKKTTSKTMITSKKKTRKELADDGIPNDAVSIVSPKKTSSEEKSADKSILPLSSKKSSKESTPKKNLIVATPTKSLEAHPEESSKRQKKEVAPPSTKSPPTSPLRRSSRRKPDGGYTTDDSDGSASVRRSARKRSKSAITEVAVLPPVQEEASASVRKSVRKRNKAAIAETPVSPLVDEEGATAARPRSGRVQQNPTGAATTEEKLDKDSGTPTSEAAEDGVVETVMHDEKRVTSASSKDDGVSSGVVELPGADQEIPGQPSAAFVIKRPSQAPTVSAKNNLPKKKKAPKKKKGEKIVDIPDAGNENSNALMLDIIEDDAVGTRTVEDKQVIVDLSKDDETAPAGAGLSVVGHEISEQPPASSAVSPKKTTSKTKITSKKKTRKELADDGIPNDAVSIVSPKKTSSEEKSADKSILPLSSKKSSKESTPKKNLIVATPTKSLEAHPEESSKRQKKEVAPPSTKSPPTSPLRRSSRRKPDGGYTTDDSDGSASVRRSARKRSKSAIAEVAVLPPVQEEASASVRKSVRKRNKAAIAETPVSPLVDEEGATAARPRSGRVQQNPTGAATTEEKLDKDSGTPTSEAAEDGVVETVMHDEKRVTSASSKDDGVSSGVVELPGADQEIPGQPSAAFVIKRPSQAPTVSAKNNLPKKKKAPKKKKGEKIVDIPDAGNENSNALMLDIVEDDAVGTRTVEDKQVIVDLSKDDETAPAGAGLSVVGHEISEQPPAGSAVSPKKTTSKTKIT